MCGMPGRFRLAMSSRVRCNGRVGRSGIGALTHHLRAGPKAAPASRSCQFSVISSQLAGSLPTCLTMACCVACCCLAALPAAGAFLLAVFFFMAGSLEWPAGISQLPAAG